jgi:cytoskeletal protein CcmA (bactofilin family)
MAASSQDMLLNTIIGAGSTFIGDLELKGMVRIDGDLLGSVTTTGKVIVGEKARCDCFIRAKSAIIGGVVKGDVIVDDNLRLLKGSTVVGNVYAPRFEAEDGVTIHGACKFSGKPGSHDDVSGFIHLHGSQKESPKARIAKLAKEKPFLTEPETGR